MSIGLNDILKRIEQLERAQGHRSVQTTTFWARTTAHVAGTDDPETGVETEVEPIINDRSSSDSHKVGKDSGSAVTVFHRGAGAITHPAVVLIEQTSLGYAIVQGAGGGGECCCCEHVEDHDTVLSDGTETTSHRILCAQLQPIKHFQPYGTLTITFPKPDEMILVRESAPVTDLFVWDIPSTAFSATYTDTTDATDDLVEPSGSVIFEHHVAVTPGSGDDCPCPMMRMRIEWDADIPEPVVGSP